MILALAFVRSDDITSFADALEDDLDEDETVVFNWFEDTYIGRMSRRGNGRRLPQFPHSLWNVHDRVLLQQDKTNNSAEAAHKKLQHELGMCHPTLWRFIDELRKIQKGRDLQFEHALNGQEPKKKLKKYIDADLRIRKIVREYDSRHPLEYLKAIANNYTIIH